MHPSWPKGADANAELCCCWNGQKAMPNEQEFDKMLRTHQPPANTVLPCALSASAEIRAPLTHAAPTVACRCAHSYDAPTVSSSKGVYDVMRRSAGLVRIAVPSSDPNIYDMYRKKKMETGIQELVPDGPVVAGNLQPGLPAGALQDVRAHPVQPPQLDQPGEPKPSRDPGPLSAPVAALSVIPATSDRSSLFLRSRHISRHRQIAQCSTGSG